MRTLIAIFIAVLAEYIFDYKATPDSTNWSIFYFSCLYSSFALIALDVIWRESSKIMQYTAWGFVALFVILTIMEVRFINVPFDSYMVGVNNTKLRVLLFGILTIIFTFISITAWEKRLSKR